jgi:uncharacterized protein
MPQSGCKACHETEEKLMYRLAIAATALVIAAFSTAPGSAQEARMPRTIALVGHGEARVSPDLAIVTAGVLSQSATAADALAANTASMNAVFDVLESEGIASRDVQTSNFMVQPRYDYSQSGGPPKLVGYDVSNNLTISVRQIGKLGALLDRLVQGGSNQINGVTFQVSKPDAAMDEARKLATQDATRKAKVYAGAMGVRLGSVMSISEGTSYQPPPPMVQAKMMRADGGSADVPIAGGEQVLSVDVSVVWEIN